ncbi:carboxylating nicotinate-nucleotide diphosphorylase [Acaryochloris sp. IP29b_bin.148]|uniref:carboxylating nicotinate-nucleotide diphosphorylase n=1 Tax=Acaryochloris sp. IP29b_bin.148 TaxID=2969218 RepID=UPI0026024A4D|nr:carboxylating nicotinate-nucleotide diphosphorylase [Acaryochloris sp. IP29b_bin.148]
MANLPPWLTLDPQLQAWLMEDIGRGDRTTQALWPTEADAWGQAELRLKQSGVLAGLPLFQRIFYLLSPDIEVQPLVEDGEVCPSGTVVAQLKGPMSALLMGERVALNLIMPLSGIATLTRTYTDQIADLPTQLVDTRKTTPGLRILEKYATQVGGAINHRMGLDDAVMIKDNHIVAAGGIGEAVRCVRQQIPFPLAIEVETETLEQVQQALNHPIDIIMLDNMAVEQMQAAVKLIRSSRPVLKIEASGNINLQTLRVVAETGVDYISTSAPITQARWLDFSLKLLDGSL